MIKTRNRLMSLLLALLVITNTFVVIDSLTHKAYATHALKDTHITPTQIEAAIKWAENQIGQSTFISQGKTEESHYNCTLFAHSAFYEGAGMASIGANGSGYYLNPEQGFNVITSAEAPVPPRGSIVLYTETNNPDGWGHVALSLGSGYVVEGGYSKIQKNTLYHSGYTYKGYIWYRDALPPIYEKLTKPVQTYDKANKTYILGDTIKLSWASSSNNSAIDHYWVGVFDEEGNQVYGYEAGKSTSLEINDINQPGKYYIHVNAIRTKDDYKQTIEEITVNPNISINISPNGGTFKGKQKVAITAEPSIGTTIYYTTDGSEPTSKSKKYTEPFTITTNTTVKACVYVTLIKFKTVTATFKKYIEPHTHTWSDWSITQNPTLSTTGKAEHICKGDSSHKEVATLPKLCDEKTWTKSSETAATCSKEGSCTYTSTYGSVTISISKKEHTYGQWEYFPATESSPPSRKRTCSVCKYEDWEDIPHGDKHTARKVEGYSATCTQTGRSDFWICDNCGMEFADAECLKEKENVTLPALGHNWGEWKITTPATESNLGVETRTCKRCNSPETRDIPLLGHTHTLVKHNAVSASCMKEGNGEYWSCSSCNKIFSDKKGSSEISKILTIAKTAHSSDGGKITKSPSCTENGVKTFKCTVCQNIIKTEDIAVLGHKWSEWKVTTPATESNPGVETRTCKRCNTPETRDIPLLGHTHTLVKHNAVSASCMKEGNGEYWSCSSCNKIFSDKKGSSEISKIPTIAKTAHKWNSGVVTTPATTSSNGIRTYTCNICQNTKTESIPRLNPSSGNVISKPNKTESSTTTSSGRVTLDVKKNLNNIRVNISTPIDRLIKATCTVDEQHLIQNGSDCKIILSVKEISDEKILLTDDSEYNVALLLDISMLKCFGDTEIEITDTNSEISVEIELPEYLRNNNQKYVVIRYHNGETNILEDIDDSENTITFKSDKFSLYGICYRIQDDNSSQIIENTVTTSDNVNTTNEISSHNITNSSSPKKTSIGVIILVITFTAALSTALLTGKRNKK